ncbi:MAG: DUF2339 domain-containing protein [Acidobacteriaceae bacterium]
MSNPQDELAALREQLAALTARIYRLEQRTGIVPEPQAPRPPAPAPVAPPPEARVPVLPAPPIPPIPPRTEAATSGERPRATEGLESQIGKLWLNRVGIIATLIGVSYFIKYAFDNNWIGPSGRIALGILAGIGLVLWSERFRLKGFAAFSYSLKVIGIGTLYLSFWGAYQIYHLVPSAAAFLAMIAVTGFTIILALKQDAEILAAFAMIGGFSTPVLLSTGQNHELVLFSYVALLDLAILGMVAVKPWRRLLVGSFVGTLTLYWGWDIAYYSKSQRPLTVFFAILFAAIFAAIPLLTPLTRSRWHKGFSITLTVLPLFNAAALFLALFAMYHSELDTLTWYALGLAAVYLVLSSQFKRRSGDPDVIKVVNLLHAAIAIAFITIAIPLKLNSHWITIGWLVESGVLLFVAVRAKVDFLRYFATATLVLGIVRLLAFDDFNVQTFIFNARFATYLVAIAILAGIVAAGSRVTSPSEGPVLIVAGILLNVLALVALTLEANDYFDRELTRWIASHAVIAGTATQQIVFQRNLSFSAIWLAYGAALMIFGFWKRSSFVRWQALVLIAFTIGKVFLYDVSELQEGYRIVSFIALGIVLMGLSYVYHRDWLKLSPGTANTKASGNSA